MAIHPNIQTRWIKVNHPTTFKWSIEPHKSTLLGDIKANFRKENCDMNRHKRQTVNLRELNS